MAGVTSIVLNGNNSTDCKIPDGRQANLLEKAFPFYDYSNKYNYDLYCSKALNMLPWAQQNFFPI